MHTAFLMQLTLERNKLQVTVVSALLAFGFDMPDIISVHRPVWMSLIELLWTIKPWLRSLT
jgi:hypothetical protein